jgi:glyoxylase-like metal-dependent hydrolase (beta-lactamase superfamily II)
VYQDSAEGTAMRPVVTEAADGVFHVQGPGTNWQLIVDGDAVTLVDAAWPRDLDLVTGSLAEVGRRPQDVAAILITHAHRDHIGTAAELHRRYDIPVRSHPDEVAHARGEVIEEISKVALLVRLWRPTVMLFAANVLRHGATAIERLPDIETFDDAAPLDVPGHPVPVATPGHTSGHCSFHLPDRGVVIAGDALVTVDLLRRRPRVGTMPPVFDHDPATSERSLDRLADLEAHIVLPGHGAPFIGTPAEAVALAPRS